MGDRELIAAILTAGMLPTLEIPRSRVQGRSGRLNGPEVGAIQRAIDHALGIYRLVLNGLEVDTLPFNADETAAQHPIGMRQHTNPPVSASRYEYGPGISAAIAQPRQPFSG